LANADPFVIQWPDKWMTDNEIRPVIEYLNRYLHDMFIRSGGGDDILEKLELESSVANIAMLSAVFKRISDLEATQTLSESVGVNAAIKSTIDRRYALLVG
jgi:hypothetical protein